MLDDGRPVVVDRECAAPDEALVLRAKRVLGQAEIAGVAANPPEVHVCINVDAVDVEFVVHPEAGADIDDAAHVGPDRGDIVGIFLVEIA